MRLDRVAPVVLPAALLAAALILPRCASGPRIPEGSAAAGTGPGYRALFRVDSEGPGGRAHMRMAVALLPPDRLRVEFYGPVGGPRLVVAVQDDRAVALLPSRKAYDSGSATPRTLDRLLGVPLDAAGLVDLLTGRPMCPPEAETQAVLTKPAATFGRTLAWYEVTCPPGDIRYRARCAERGGTLREATVQEGISGAMILAIEYEDHQEGRGPRWPRRMKIHLARRGTTVSLAAQEGPVPSDLPASIFSPPIPDGFERRPLLISLDQPGLLGPTPDEGNDGADGSSPRQDQP
ncbi:MAG TPA: hypothetical protein VNL37_02570 [Candidatus Polarisedimenticolia bacterium]|nr:hypothetical protein [Candidatus Polarisedimenticolia bacterium]